ncbi:hypothetical protein [Haloarcula litorea]|uniref:hypothetical protein n=1 Tax=Haloarcula litorea TaxID=3032579 RepID=UPI0023E88E60|nr:hypothetical protein [Halomicroarcula sp. GDY20]
MDDAARLRRTVRRCTALVLFGLALVTGSLDNRTTAAVAVAVGFGAVLYLVASFVFVPTAETLAVGDDDADDGTRAG